MYLITTVDSTRRDELHGNSPQPVLKRHVPATRTVSLCISLSGYLGLALGLCEILRRGIISTLWIHSLGWICLSTLVPSRFGQED